MDLNNKYLVERGFSFQCNDKYPTENLSSEPDAKYIEYAKIL